MDPEILIISNKGDYTSDVLIKRLHEKKISFFRFNTEEFTHQTEASLSFSKDDSTIQLIHEGEIISLDAIKGIWYRRPLPPCIHKDLNKNDSLFAVRESKEFLLNLWLLLEDRNWINNPFQLNKVERKSFQLKTAIQCGFQVPDTLITNNSQHAELFFQANNRSIIAKPLSHGGYGNNDDYVIYSIDLESIDEIPDWNSTHHSPTIFQKRIDKQYDIRLTAIGKRLFAHAIEQKNKNKVIDWRREDPKYLKYREVDIPRSIEKRIYQFMEIMGIKFGAFDFAIQNDDWYFLEVNPSGQWAWLELTTGSKMSESLIDLLLGS